MLYPEHHLDNSFADIANNIKSPLIFDQNLAVIRRMRENQLAFVQPTIATMRKTVADNSEFQKAIDQLARRRPSPITPRLYRRESIVQPIQVFYAEKISDTVKATFAKVLRNYNVALSSLDISAQVAKVSIPDWKYHTPAIDFASLFADAVPVADLFSELRSDTSDIFEETRQQLTDLFKRLNIDDCAASLPSNWIDAGLEDYDYGLLEQLILDEGLALAWVVEPDLLTQLLTAESESERREMLAKHWEEVTDHCCKLLDKVTSQKLAEWRGFALKVAHALRHDNPEAAQALAASLIETMLVDNFTYDGKRERMKRENRPQISLGAISRGIVYGGLWGVFLKFRTDRDPIPSRFSRHASAHAVSTAQYTLTNSVIAFMHVVAYLCLWQEGDIEEKAV